jgi:hypothetical protein
MLAHPPVDIINQERRVQGIGFRRCRINGGEGPGELLS